MKSQNPKKNMDCLEKVLQALREFAPEASFGGVSLTDFEEKVQQSRQSRTELAAKEAAVLNGIIKRDNDDETALALKTLIVNGVIGDPNFGPDSALYEAMGYIRKSDRQSGLTRKNRAAAKS